MDSRSALASSSGSSITGASLPMAPWRCPGVATGADLKEYVRRLCFTTRRDLRERWCFSWTVMRPSTHSVLVNMMSTPRFLASLPSSSDGSVCVVSFTARCSTPVSGL